VTDAERSSAVTISNNHYIIPENLSQPPTPATWKLPERRKVVPEFFQNPFRKTIHRRGFKNDLERLQYIKTFISDLITHCPDHCSRRFMSFSRGGIICVEVPGKTERYFEHIEYKIGEKKSLEIVKVTKGQEKAYDLIIK
jgi:hypothetical protein